MARTIRIGGKDYTSYFTPRGARVSYRPVDGGNGGLMQSGIYTEDEIALKRVLTLTTMPLSAAQLKELLTDIYGPKYCTVYFYDPKAGAYATMTARREVSEQTNAGDGANSIEYWTGVTVTFTER